MTVLSVTVTQDRLKRIRSDPVLQLVVRSYLYANSGSYVLIMQAGIRQAPKVREAAAASEVLVLCFSAPSFRDSRSSVHCLV